MSLRNRFAALVAAATSPETKAAPATNRAIGTSTELQATLIPQAQDTPPNYLDELCREFGGTYDRKRDPEQPLEKQVRVRMHLPDGDVVSGHGPSTEAATAHLRRRLEAWAALGAL